VRGEEVFPTDGAGDGGGVEVEFFGNGLHGERFKLRWARFEKGSLFFNEDISELEEGELT